MESVERSRLAALAHTLMKLGETDQTMRREGNIDADIDRSNTEQLQRIVADIGWPTASLVGAEAARMAWLVVQHADHDPKFQRQCLELMNKAPDNEVSREDVAYLEDRVRVAEGRPQLYGTQFEYDEETEVFGPSKIEDPDNLDKRRAEVGMIPFAEYEAHQQHLFDQWQNTQKEEAL